MLAVAATVLEYGGDEDLAIAALRHDSVEDHGGMAGPKDVRDRFGDRVADLVVGCSNSVADRARGERKLDWQTRRTAYVGESVRSRFSPPGEMTLWY